MNRDDVVKTKTVAGETGQFVYHLEGDFSADRVLSFRFHQKKLTDFGGGAVFEEALPRVAILTISDQNREYKLYHRKTGADTGNTVSGSRVTQIMTSLFIQALADQEAADAAEAEAQRLRDQQQNTVN